MTIDIRMYGKGQDVKREIRAGPDGVNGCLLLVNGGGRDREPARVNRYLLNVNGSYLSRCFLLCAPCRVEVSAKSY